MPSEVILYILLFAAIIIFLSLFFSFVPVGLWISAAAANVKVGIFNLIGMRLRRVTPTRVVTPLIKATKAGLDININKLEAHFLAGGNVDRVVNALIAPNAPRFLWVSNGRPPLTWRDVTF